jgi:hypothetical protein
MSAAGGSTETGGGTANARAFVCDENSCMCAGVDDCNDMFTGKTCGPDAVWLGDGQGSFVCICIPA